MTLENGWKATGTYQEVIGAALDLLKDELPDGNAYRNWSRYKGKFDHWYNDAKSALSSAHTDLVLISPEDGTVILTKDDKTGMASLECVALEGRALEAWLAMKAECEKHGLPVQYPSDLNWDRWSLYYNQGGTFVWLLHNYGSHMCTLTRHDTKAKLEAMANYVEQGKRIAQWYLWDGETLIWHDGPISFDVAYKLAGITPPMYYTR